VAIYGDDFATAGKRVNNLFFNRGFWDTIINDWVINRVLSVGAVGIALCTSFFGYIMGGVTLSSSGASNFFAIYGFVIGLSMASVVVSTIDSAVATVYVAFGEDPDSLRANHPHEFRQLYDGWQQAYPQVVGYILLV